MVKSIIKHLPDSSLIFFHIFRFFGRKACIRPLSDGLSDQNEEKDKKKHSKKDKEEDSTEKESKSKKLRF